MSKFALAWLVAAAAVAMGCATSKPADEFDASDGNGSLSDGGPDATTIDAGAPGGTCEPCENNADCQSDHQCVIFGSEWTCLPRCNAVLPDCPDDFICGGVETTFCAPLDGVCCVDGDDDTYGQGFQCTGPDCDDEDEDIHPGMPEICNGDDDDCDPSTDDGVSDSLVGVDCDGDDTDLCEEGTSYCGSGEVLCDDATNDNVDMCNGIDDDCNPATLDGADDPSVNLACDSTADPDLCLDDLQVCNSSIPAVECQDLPGGPLDICDGADNDCNPATPDGSGDPGVGVSCDGTGIGGDADLCEEGTSYCSGGHILCDDPNVENPDLCNGDNEDCDLSTPDGAHDPDVGLTCDGSDGDLCHEGFTVCNGGFEECSDTSGTNAEICNGSDDNCMGGIDEMDPNVSCPGQYPGAQNVSSWGCSGDCVVLGCSGSNADIDTWVANGCECGGMDSYANTCGSATVRGVGKGATVNVSGKIATATGSDWLRFDFTNTGAPGNYHPRIRLTGTAGGQFIMDVRETCGAIATCTAGTGSSITTWEANWTYTPGNGCCSDSKPHVTQVRVRVFRRLANAPTCSTYTVEATNP